MTPERKEKIERVLHHRQPDLVVVMENVNDIHNVMAVARSCDSVGVQTVFVIHDEEKKGFNVFNKGVKSSASANKWVDFVHFSSTKECLEQLKRDGFVIYSTHLGEQAVELYEVDFTQKIALLFGNEKYGVSEEALELSDGNFIIPQVGMIQSLNISVACAVSLYEAFRQRKNANYYSEKRFTNKEYATIFERWAEKK